MFLLAIGLEVFLKTDSLFLLLTHTNIIASLLSLKIMIFKECINFKKTVMCDEFILY